AIKADAKGLEISTQGLASLSSDSFQKIYERSSKSATNAMPIYFDQDTVAWPDFSLVWDAGWKITQPLLTHPQQFISLRKADEGRMNFLALSNSKLSVWQFSSQKQSFDKIAESTVASTVQGDDLLVDGADVLVRSSEGISLVRDGKSLPTSLTMPKHKIILQASSDAFVQEKSATACVWRHFINNAQFANSFKESGLTVPCANLESFTANDKAVTVSSFRAGLITIDSLKK
ncbi:MAG: hypothetical protein NTX25_22810, partial [Proteobacteria bacterium]|nr:hypothetical protein [Pseudomonadota bacterium]